LIIFIFRGSIKGTKLIKWLLIIFGNFLIIFNNVDQNRTPRIDCSVHSKVLYYPRGYPRSIAYCMPLRIPIRIPLWYTPRLVLGYTEQLTHGVDKEPEIAKLYAVACWHAMKGSKEIILKHFLTQNKPNPHQIARNPHKTL